MTAYFKDGKDFVVRCGGPGDFQWFRGAEFEKVMRISGMLPRFHPARTAFQAANTVTNLLDWWAYRKDNILQVAQFEERRILWVVDILQQYFTELNRGEVKLDTIFYLEREFSRYFQKSQESELNEFPSSLLLQVYRAAGLQASINHGMVSVLETVRAKGYPGPDVCEPVKANYKPFNKTNLDENSWIEIEALWKELATIEKITFILIPMNPELLAAEILRKNNMKTKRGSEFSPISQFFYELLWTKNLASLLKSKNEVVLVYKSNKVNFDIEPDVIFSEMLSPKETA